MNTSLNLAAMDALRKVQRQGKVVITDVGYLQSEYGGMASDDIKNNKSRDTTEQLPTSAQLELSLRGQRTRFIEFHRVMFSMSDIELQLLNKAYKRYYADNRLGQDDSIYTDVSLLKDAIDYQLCVRSADGFDAQHVAEEVAINFHENVKLIKDSDEVTSEHLIRLIQEITAGIRK